MARTTIDDLKHRRLAGMTTDERAEFDAAYDATRLAIEVGEQIRDAREEAGLASASSRLAWAPARPRWLVSRPVAWDPRSPPSRRWPPH